MKIRFFGAVSAKGPRWLLLHARNAVAAKNACAGLSSLVLSVLALAQPVAAQEYIAGVRLGAPAEITPNVTVPVTIQFLDASGRVVAPEPGRAISMSPSGVYPCQVSRCNDADYSETFLTNPGQDAYTVYVRSLITGLNSLTVTHPNGSSTRAVFNSTNGGGTGGGGGQPAPVPPPPPAQTTPSQFGLLDGAPALTEGTCTTVRVQLEDSAGNRAPLNNARAVTLNPGGGVHPSNNNCASYQNDPITVAAGESEFSFSAYVVSAYGGNGRITVSASGLGELQIPFAAGSPPAEAAPPPPQQPPPVEPPTTPPAPPVTPTPANGVIVWANDGGEKIIREETRAFAGDVTNSHWDGTTIRTFGARNEVVSFTVVIDNQGADLNEVRVDFDELTNDSFRLKTTDTGSNSVFDWRNRPIEVFSVGYLKIHGLSRIAYELYDETHTPEKFRRPYRDLQPQAPAIGSGSWFDRPHANKSYPDIAIPQEVQPTTAVRSGNSQSFWVDIYLPKDAPAGILRGTLRVSNGSEAFAVIPVEVTVADFQLDDESKAKSMVYLGDRDIVERYFTGIGAAGALPVQSYDNYRKVVDRHFMLAWRHHVSLIDGNALIAFGTTPIDQPNEDWKRRLRGDLYTAANGYKGPGENREHDVFSIGTYSNWTRWWDLLGYDPENPNYDSSLPVNTLTSVLRQRTDQWENWFRNNAPNVERFLYVDDEPTFTQSRDPNFSTVDWANRVSQIVKENPGPGGSLPTFITSSPLGYDNELPLTSILGDVIAHGQTALWDDATNALRADPDREYFMYNGRRPASGTFVIDDDGVALRELPWGQYKKGIGRWYYWHSTYYNNFQGGPSQRNLNDVDPEGYLYRNGTETNVFKSAHTFGGHTHFDAAFGETGWNYSNGDGLLFYPGTDLVFPEESKGLNGPMASLRLKHWRRGVQDVIYIEQAMARDPAATNAIINEMVPEVMWEVGVANPEDPTYVHKPPSWSNDPDVWENARRRLANIILGYDAL